MTSDSGAQLWRDAKANPEDALQRAEPLLDTAHDDPWILAAAGRAAFELGRNADAISWLTDAVETTADERDRAEMSVSLAAALAAHGDTAPARTLLAEIADTADLTIRALAVSQTGLLDLHAGEPATALVHFEHAAQQLTADVEFADAAARTVGNAGYCLLLLDRVKEARQRFDQAKDIAAATGQLTVVAGCLQNIGYCEMRLGQLSSALGTLESARHVYRELGNPARNVATLLDDLAETYRVAGLTTDAVSVAREAVEVARRGDSVEKQADTGFRLAQCLLDAGDHDEATLAAAMARTRFESTGRMRWVDRCDAISIEAASTAPEQPVDEQAAEGLILRLAQSGWRTEAQSVRNAVALRSYLAGNTVDLPEVESEQGESVMAELEGLLGEAIRLASNDPRPALQRAATTIRDHAARLGDPEMRAGVLRLGARLHSVEAHWSLAHGTPTDVLIAAHRFRLATLLLPRATPLDDPSVAAIAERLRELSRSRHDAEDDTVLDGQIRAEEDRLRAATQRHRSNAVAAAAQPVDPSALHETLGQDAAVAWIRDRGQLVCAATQDGTTRLHRCGDAQDLSQRAARLRRDLARLCRPGLSPASADRRWTALIADARAVGDRLLPASLRATPRPLRVMPPPELREMPWSLVAPTSEGVVVVDALVPTTSSAEPTDQPAIGFLAGPGLDFVEAEHAAIERHGLVVTVARNRDDAIDVAGKVDILHVACHGQFRSDSPRFSTLQLDGEPLALHDLDAIASPPRGVILSACDAGRSGSIGTEPIGSVPAWRAAGVETVIAPICAIDDQIAAEVAPALYAHVERRPSAALRQTQRQLDDAGIAARAVAAAFNCEGIDRPMYQP